MRATPFQGSSASTRIKVPHAGSRARALAVRVQAKAATQAPSKHSDAVLSAVGLLKQAVSTKAVPSAQVSEALVALDAAKLDPASFINSLASQCPPGKLWNLVYTMRAQKRNKPNQGFYPPIVGTVSLDASTNTMTNGAYFGYIASVTFVGKYNLSDPRNARKLSFQFQHARVRLGPWTFTVDENTPLFPKTKPGRPGPFFLVAYGDDDILVMRGKSGGIAVWKAVSSAWALQNGVEGF